MNCLNTYKVEGNKDTVSTCLSWQEFIKKNDYRNGYSLNGILNGLSELKMAFSNAAQGNINSSTPFQWSLFDNVTQGNSYYQRLGNQILIHRITVHVTVLQFVSGALFNAQNRFSCWALKDTATFLVDAGTDLNSNNVGVSYPGPEHRYHKIADEHFAIGFPANQGYNRYQKYFTIDIDYGPKGKIITFPWMYCPIVCIHTTKDPLYNILTANGYATLYFRDI